ncbi:type IX secretion system periplasmic lipoprotein PorW/SprE [Dawidia soli]|uniref:Tetratricopeptide repeat protein n=1 Tax=Dawidia soli TaxID=2782352 RepID=A0AAP2GFS8_9BACT|nr:tetratricopeptide repeat protein [Dawidia soli]MBT1685401.1 tetratricopeptide repeat protein [Dawidia soli]
MKNIVYYLVVLLTLILLNGCSSASHSWTAKAYHNTTAHYNGYWYAREELDKIDQDIWAAYEDDYNRILRLYPPLDSAQAKGYDKEIQEAVKMASLAIQRHPNSKWVDDGYILVGRARFYSLDWGNSIQTFKYVNTKSKDLDTRHRAIIHLIRTFTEHQEFNNAQAAIDFVQKMPLTKTNKKHLLLEKAYFYQMQGDLDKMVRNLSEAVPLLKKRDKPGRIYFIIGQVYQKLGFEAEAYNYYKKCIATNPEYEVDFYARLYMAQVTEISRSKDVNAARKSFRKLLKDGKNKDFQDKIYYEMGVFELKQKNLDEAIADFNRSVRAGSNKRIDGEAYLRLGEIYYDTLRQYQLSQAYYDSAINSLPKDYEGYARIKARQEVLNEFVKHLNTIKWQDSLLALAAMDTAALRAQIKANYEAKKREEEKRAAAEKKRRGGNRIDLSGGRSNPMFANENGDQQEVDWYFGNPSAMSVGESEFKRVWGNVPLEDNWRRSLRSTVANNEEVDDTAPDDPNEQKPTNEPPPADPVAAEYDRLDKQIPRTEEEKQQALDKIEDAYFKLGDIYYFKLQESDNAVTTYNTLLKRFPETKHEAEVLYKLYLIYKNSDPGKAERYASLLLSKYPDSTFAKLLKNPNYLAESEQTGEKQKVLYKDAYEQYTQGDYAASRQIVGEALALGQTTFVPNLELLQVLIIGKTENAAQYQYGLEEFIKKYPEAAITEYAKTLLQSSRDFQTKQERRMGIQYIRSLEEPHYFIMIYRKDEKLSDVASAVLDKFNLANFKDLSLKTSNLILNDDYALTMVSELPRVTSAIEYAQTFKAQVSKLPELQNHKFNTFVITKDNFDIFYRTKGLDEYIQFFQKNYPAEAQ